MLSIHFVGLIESGDLPRFCCGIDLEKRGDVFGHHFSGTLRGVIFECRHLSSAPRFVGE